MGKSKSKLHPYTKSPKFCNKYLLKKTSNLSQKAVDHDGVEANDEEQRQEIAKDKEAHLRYF